MVKWVFELFYYVTWILVARLYQREEARRVWPRDQLVPQVIPEGQISHHVLRSQSSTGRSVCCGGQTEKFVHKANSPVRYADALRITTFEFHSTRAPINFMYQRTTINIKNVSSFSYKSSSHMYDFTLCVIFTTAGKWLTNRIRLLQSHRLR